MRQLALTVLLGGGLGLSACATGPTGAPAPDDVFEAPASGPVVIAQPNPAPPLAPPAPAPPKPAPLPPEPVVTAPVKPVQTRPDANPFDAVDGWATADPQPAFAAFVRGCESLLQGEPDAPLNPALPHYGTYADWREPCERATGPRRLKVWRAADYRAFFERYFAPVVEGGAEDGLLTGYYEPEVDVRLRPDAVYSEPILALPKNAGTRKLPRSRIDARTSRVIAYGKPIDVFFLQIQGSGRLRYADGRSLRAAYAGNNGKPYRSIGRVLIETGEITKDQSSKVDIERWMARAGPKRSRALMNENPRYIFFTEQAVAPGSGPNGAMRVPLTAMGSIAVDPRYHPYGTLAFLNTKLPSRAGDYRGRDTGLLVAMQDTGNAIRGPLRADLFFGSGAEAGARAGVMKHPVRWTLLLPKALVEGEARVAMAGASMLPVVSKG